LTELEVNLHIKNYSEDANRNGIGLKQMVLIQNQNQILKNLPRIRLKLKDLPRNSNGIKITGTWVETNTMIRFKLLSKVKQQLKLQLNKKLNHS
jgi:hypothetical protein